MRLDKFLCSMGCGTRSQVKVFLKKGQVAVNGDIVLKPEFRIDETADAVTFCGQRLLYEKYKYFMFHKPSGCVTATKDPIEKTVMDYFPPNLRQGLFPVGRLDKDTEGFLLVTNDGELAHRLLSPGRHVPKTYYVELENTVTPDQCIRLEQGVDIGEKKPTRPAKAEILSGKAILLTIEEGKFHQIKRMLKAVGNRVVYLRRESMGGLSLDKALRAGCYRELSETERSLL